ncbi:MAG: class I SAM-dependent methyltransferase [Gammaproteobacteria bacterium]|nr:class I SAM-dependent methyltransferase [Gammaproteobacteria bacterium]
MIRKTEQIGTAPASAHDFHDPGYVRRWARQAIVRTPVRNEFIACIVARATALAFPRPAILEYGCGPGFLAECLLESIDVSAYWLIDFSEAMLDLCAERLARFDHVTRYAKRDFTLPDWLAGLPCRPDLVVSMQASHEVRSKAKVDALYAQILESLTPAGGFLMCDLTADGSSGPDQSVFLTMDKHLDALQRAGFDRVAPLMIKGGLGLAAGFRNSR